MTAYIKWAGGERYLNLVVGPRGKSAAQQLFDAGIIDAPTPEALDAYLTALWLATGLRVDALELAAKIPLTRVTAGATYMGSGRNAVGGTTSAPAKYRFPDPGLARQYSVQGGMKRGTPDRFADFGAKVSDHLRDAFKNDGYAALLRAVTKDTRVLLDKAGLLIRARILATALSGTVLVALKTVSAAGVPTLIFTDPAADMLTGVAGARDIRLEGAHHWTYQQKSTGPSWAVDLLGVKGFYADYLAITNANNGMRGGVGTEDVNIRHLHVEADQAINFAVGCARVRIERVTGTGTIVIATGADCIIGPDRGLLPGLGNLAPTPNKMIIMDANGVPQLVDRIPSGTVWTPGLTCVTPGNFNPNISSLSAGYSKRDRDMHVWSSFITTPTYDGSASGDLILTGLPFVADSASALAVGHFSTLTSGITWPNTSTQLSIAVQAGTATAKIIGQKSASSTAIAQVTALAPGVAHTLRIDVRYRSAT